MDTEKHHTSTFLDLSLDPVLLVAQGLSMAARGVGGFQETGLSPSRA